LPITQSTITPPNQPSPVRSEQFIPPTQLAQPSTTITPPSQTGTPVSPPGALTSQQAMRRRGLFSRIPHPLAFFGGLAVQVADFTWLAIIIQHGDNDPFLSGLSVLSFLFAIVLLVILIITGLITMARLKHWGWFIGLLLGSIGGTAIFFLPGLALIVFGLVAPRTPRMAPGPA